MKKVLTITAGRLGAALLAGASGAAYGVWNNLTASDRRIAAAFDAGFVERTATVAGHTLNYAESPDNGPALQLIHGQSTDWKSYAASLPELTERHHVFAVDCFGHGSSARAPELYTAARHGEALSSFVDAVIAEPVLVSGHSSGGHLAAYLAANNERVRGVLMAAMGHEEAARARGLIPGVRFVKVETGHGSHDEDPEYFIALVDDLRARVGACPPAVGWSVRRFHG